MKRYITRTRVIFKTVGGNQSSSKLIKFIHDNFVIYDEIKIINKLAF